MLEATVEGRCVKAAEKAGWLVRKVRWVGRRDAPDRLFLKGGRTVWVEFKRPGADARAGQKREHERMRAKGADVRVYDSYERFCEEVLCETVK